MTFLKPTQVPSSVLVEQIWCLVLRGFGGSNETARFDHAVWRCSGCMAARRARAAGRKAADHRFLGRGCFGLRSLDGGLCGTFARTRLDRGPYSCDRISLVAG